MNVIDSKLSHLIEGSYTSDIGAYYFFNGFVISEIKEGAIFNWEESLEIQSVIDAYYGEDYSICYISNRINNYSVKPTDWLKFKKKNKLNGYCIVSYTEQGWVNALIEKLFVPSKMQRFKNLYDAVAWAKKENDQSDPGYLSAM